MTEAATLQIVSMAGLAVGVAIAAVCYWSITQELKRPEPNQTLTQALWVAVAGGLLMVLLSGWGQMQLASAKKTPSSGSPATATPATSSTTASKPQTAPTSSPAPVSSDVASLKTQLEKQEKNLEKYRALQKAFADNREKWQEVLDLASRVVGDFRPDVQKELKTIRERLSTKLVEEDK